jgi:hypothetical protein
MNPVSRVEGSRLRIRDAVRRWIEHRKAPPAVDLDWRQFQQQRIRQERACLHEACGELGLEILDILARKDPLHIVSEANPAEYHPVVRTIMPRLRSARCVEDVQRYVYEEMVHWLGEAQVKPVAAYSEMGQEIWEATKRLGSPPRSSPASSAAEDAE